MSLPLIIILSLAVVQVPSIVLSTLKLKRAEDKEQNTDLIESEVSTRVLVLMITFIIATFFINNT